MCSEQKVHGLRSASTINCVKRSKFQIISNYISDNGRLTNANVSIDVVATEHWGLYFVKISTAIVVKITVGRKIAD